MWWRSAGALATTAPSASTAAAAAPTSTCQVRLERGGRLRERPVRAVVPRGALVRPLPTLQVQSLPLLWAWRASPSQRATAATAPTPTTTATTATQLATWLGGGLRGAA